MLTIKDWFIVPERNELLRGDTVLTVKPKAMDVLVQLVRANGTPVSTKALLDACWPGRVVVDAVVHNRIAELRAALGDDAANPHYIRTVPGRGYATMQGATDRTKRLPSDDNPRVAVLPFVNLSSDSEQDYFCEGISEDVLDGLARNPGLTVRARHSSFIFKWRTPDLLEIAETLNVSHVVSGSVRMADHRIRISARLTDLKAEADVWSDRYDRELTDIFAIQDEIAASIANALGLHLAGPTRTAVDMDAYRAYLLGRSRMHHHEWHAAIDSYQRAIEIDPGYADAYAAIAHLYSVQAGYAAWPDLEALQEKRREFIDKALEHDPKQPLARGLKALRLPAQEAVDELDTLIRSYPSDPDLHLFYGLLARRIGRPDLSAALMDKMVSLNPLSPFSLYNRAMDHAVAGRLQAAKDDSDTCEAMGLPAALVLTNAALAERDIETIEAQTSRPPEDWLEAPVWRAISAACGAYLQRDTNRVGTILAELDGQLEQLPLFVRHFVALLNDDLEAAADYFEQSLELGETVALVAVQGPLHTRTLFPEFFCSDRYFAILRKFKLDADALAELSIPPLPP